MNEELTLAIEELRQRPTDQSWFIPVLLNECDVPDRNIGAGETLMAIQSVRIYEDWDKGVSQILSIVQPASGAVFESIRQLSDRSARVRIRAVDNLAQMRGIAKAAIPSLVNMLDEENETVRAAAAAALGDIGIPDKTAVFKLLSITGDDGHPYYPSMHANTSLVTMGQTAVPVLVEALGDMDRRIREAALKTIVKIGHVAVHELTLALASIDPRVRELASRALAVMGQAQVKSAGASPVASLIRVLQQDQDESARASAADALGEMGDANAVPALTAALADQNYLCVCAALALGKIGGPEVIGPLIEVLKDKEKFWVPRGAAALALGNLGKEAEPAVPALTEALDYDIHNAGESWDERAREAVVDAIRRIEDPSAPSMLKGKGYRYEMWGVY
jgi:HEAT repeat protein